MGKTALITGALGQDASYLAELLLNKKYTKVIGIHRRSVSSDDWRVRHLRECTSFLLTECDITDFGNVLRILIEHRPDEIYNLAAQSHVATSFNEPSHTLQAGINGTLNILESVKLLNLPAKLYQASSSEMFGDSYSENIIAAPPHMDIKVILGKYQDENTRMNPQSPYAIGKLASYNLTRLYRKSYGMFCSNGILFNHESPRRGLNFVTRKITNYVARLYLGKVTDHLQLGNLDASRDWGHARDYVEAMYLMLQQDKPDDFVVATGETHTVREFADLAFKHIGQHWEEWVKINAVYYRPSEVPYLRGSAEKAKSVLGWQPKTSFKDLVEEMVWEEIEAMKIKNLEDKF